MLHLDRQPGIENIAGCDRRDLILIEVQLAKKEIQELGPLKPPVPIKLCVIRRYDERRAAFERVSKLMRLTDAFAYEVARIFGGFFPS